MTAPRSRDRSMARINTEAIGALAIARVVSHNEC
jgi:hypothetical protein